MCGLFGSLGFTPERERIDIVAHRGPDGSGWQEFRSGAGPVALGHRRLAIIDVSDAGLQPMADRSGRLHLVFNGEIYNYIELREELRAKGHVFVSDSDSEVLLAAYAEWGEDCLQRFLGMFAFIIWDEREQRLFAARDRFGIKPLYMVANRHGLAFGSEIKQLLGLPGLSGSMNLARIRDFLASGITNHTAETLFAGVQQVQPGCSVSVEAARPWTGEVSPRRWYAIPPSSGLELSEAQAAEKFRELFTDAVRMHLRSDVPIGSCLSGGLDSSSIVCVMSELLDRQGQGAKVNTVSACYAEKSVDEKPFMEQVVSQTGASPNYIFPRPEEVFARASDITWHQDEPFGSTSIFAQWCVFEEARRAGIKVMLDGQGADEQLAGYHSAYVYYMSDLIRRGEYATLIRTMAERNRYHGISFRDQVSRYVVPLIPPKMRSFLIRQRQSLVYHDWTNSEVFQALGPARSVIDVASEANGLPAITDIASFCLVLTMSSNLPMLLHWEDRNSMAHSIEARVPFLDHRLVEFNLALGNSHKILHGDTKRVLRSAMKGILPEPVRNRRDKLGFATPEQEWFRGPLKGLIKDGVEATLSRYPGLLDAAGTRALAADMLEGRRNVDFTLWRIVNLGLWGDRFNVSLG
ncbi:asparagine synthase (glutamine-hydrolyzing) [Microvirga puerhi]|uniref:asparagine synthase (glutamine-hydrolyzing) n=1 Tax=Microvirga puerhi TaxID=2876078 RepID=A0ABS7VL86_9HYPH|nr:asparagine synthase (glutamine-hydrolyzing) [Microvirga puerhi]MBZ6076286.1 asparagine synthase (glutamine-hydrolyzing) [Microvirga puerhi]